MAAKKTREGSKNKFKITVRAIKGKDKGKMYDRYFKTEAAMQKGLRAYEEERSAEAVRQARQTTKQVAKRTASSRKKQIAEQKKRAGKKMRG